MRTSSPLKDSPRRRQVLGTKPILERIESGLTVNIGNDLRVITGKEPPKVVNRANGSSPTHRPSHKAPPQKANGRAGDRNGAKSAGKPTMKRTNTTPIEVNLHSSFGIQLGNKLFKN